MAGRSSVGNVVSLEFRPGKLITEWFLDEAETYVAACEEICGDKRLDVVAVSSLLDTGLTRAESVAACRATPGTYFYDPDQLFEFPGMRWDRDSWDSGFYWDQFPLLYVHLMNGISPLSTSVSAYFGVFVANEAMVQPTLSPSKLANGGFEVWSSATDCDDWTESLADHAISKEATKIAEGSYAAKIEAMNAGPTSHGRMSQAVTTIIGHLYRASGLYYASDDISPSLSPSLCVSGDPGGGTEYLDEDGRSTHSTETRLALKKHPGAWRRFSLDFRAFAASTTVCLSLEGGGSGHVVYDGARVQHINRYEYHENRLGEMAIPEITVGSNDIYFGGKQTGSGTIEIVNLDGSLTALAARLDVENHEIILRSGGLVGDIEVPFESWIVEFIGLVQRSGWSDASLTFDLLDHRINLHRNLPPRTYEESPDLDVSYLGKPRPLFFGLKNNITPIRIGVDTTYSKYGKYEIADCERAPNGIKEISVVYAYDSAAAASEKRTNERKQLTAGTDYSEALANGQFTVLRDIGPYIIHAENNKLNFDVGGAELTATLLVGAFVAAELAAHIQTRMREAVGGGDTTVSVTYSETSNKFTISKSSGTLNLKVQSGSNSEISVYPSIGFSKSSDLTGSLTYEAEEAVFVSAAESHILRVNAKGYKDDASGTYTGTANALIETGADMCRVLLLCYLNRPAGIIDETSFLFARQRAPESLAIYLNNMTSSKDIFDRLEFSNVANIVVGGDGTVYYLVYVGEVPANIIDLYNRDYADFSMERSVSDVYGTIVISFDKDPTTGELRGRSATDASVGLRSQRAQPREFETYLKTSDNAAALANRILTLASRPARKISVSTYGRIVALKVGDKVRLSRDRALDPSGRISSQVFRILSIRRQPLSRLVRAEMVDDVVTVAGVACITTCQYICELFNQAACALACQESCQITTCQGTCEVVSQGCGYTLCMAACETTCQGCGQTSCQVGCEIACEGCEATCEGCGETSCQDACETACQGCWQTSCEAGCEASCQAGCAESSYAQACCACEVGCQGCGETECQETCEGACQDVCQATCQATCQYVCQSSSEYY